MQSSSIRSAGFHGLKKNSGTGVHAVRIHGKVAYRQRRDDPLTFYLAAAYGRKTWVGNRRWFALQIFYFSDRPQFEGGSHDRSGFLSGPRKRISAVHSAPLSPTSRVPFAWASSRSHRRPVSLRQDSVGSFIRLHFTPCVSRFRISSVCRRLGCDSVCRSSRILMKSGRARSVL